MRLSSVFTIAGTFAAAGLVCWVAAGFAVTVIEDTSRSGVRDALDEGGLTWAEVDTDGLQVFLGGTAPTEATRFNAIQLAGSVVESARVIDQMLVEDSAVLTPPRFSVEILRNDAGISLIGLIPAATDRERLMQRIYDAADGADVADLLETADYPVAGNWDPAVEYALRALAMLPRAKVSIKAGRVEIKTMTDTPGEKLTLESDLMRRVPPEITVALDVAAPRPVITPFTLRFLIEDGTARFDACSADTEDAKRKIVTAARDAGLARLPDCIIGLGVPTPEWGDAAAQAIRALGQLGGGSVTFADADIALIAAPGTNESRFDDIVGGLQNELPDVFVLKAVLPPPEDDSAPVVPDFVATLSPEGLVQLRGKLGSAQLLSTVDSFAKARFTTDSVYTQARVVDGLPSDWPVRVLTGLEALPYLSNGAVTVTPDLVRVTGNTGRKDASAQIAGLLAGNLGEAGQFDIEVTYKEELDPIASIPEPEECIEMIAAIQSDRKITFEPGSVQIEGANAAIMDDISEVLDKCGDIRIEIGGHTDSQGRETMNQDLSQKRANAVLDALRARRVLTASYTAVGYGEVEPIADNDTEEGRELNRRIEFKLIRPEPVPERETGLESLEQDGDEEASVQDTADDAADDPADESTAE